MNPDDPRLTAYALGEFDVAGRAEIEQILREEPVIAAEIEMTRQFAETLSLRLKSECVESLHTGQRAEVLACAARETPRGTHASPRQNSGWLALAAGVVLGIGLALLFPALNSLRVHPIAAGGRQSGLRDGSDVRVSLDAEPARLEENLVVVNEWSLEGITPVLTNLHGVLWAPGRMAFNGGDSVLHFDTKLPVIEFTPPPVAPNPIPVLKANRRNVYRPAAGPKTLREARYATAPTPLPAPDWGASAEELALPEDRSHAMEFPASSANFR